jgi:hypothetical protein
MVRADGAGGPDGLVVDYRRPGGPAARAGASRRPLAAPPVPGAAVTSPGGALGPDGTRPTRGADLLAVIRAARAAQSRLWPGRTPGHGGLVILIAAFAVDGLAGGLYLAGPGRPRRLAVPEGAALRQALRGRAAGAAALAVCGNLARATERDPTGYGALLTGAGALGQAIAQAAAAAGLDAAIDWPSLSPATAVARVIDRDLRHLFTVSIGPGPARRAGAGPA